MSRHTGWWQEALAVLAIWGIRWSTQILWIIGTAIGVGIGLVWLIGSWVAK